MVDRECAVVDSFIPATTGKRVDTYNMDQRAGFVEKANDKSEVYASTHTGDR